MASNLFPISEVDLPIAEPGIQFVGVLLVSPWALSPSPERRDVASLAHELKMHDPAVEQVEEQSYFLNLQQAVISLAQNRCSNFLQIAHTPNLW